MITVAVALYRPSPTTHQAWIPSSRCVLKKHDPGSQGPKRTPDSNPLESVCIRAPHYSSHIGAVCGRFNRVGGYGPIRGTVAVALYRPSPTAPSSARVATWPDALPRRPDARAVPTVPWTMPRSNGALDHAPFQRCLGPCPVGGSARVFYACLYGRGVVCLRNLGKKLAGLDPLE